MESNDMIALCAIGRMENRYAREFVEYHLSLGFDKIFICDNNFDCEDRFEDVLGDYVAEGAVKILDYRNRKNIQLRAYAECYTKYGGSCRWMAFFDFDEFLTIVGSENIHDFMRRYDGADCLLVNWRNFTDSGLLRYDGRPVRERFTVPMPNDRCVSYDFPENRHVKCIVRGGLQYVSFQRNPHVPSMPLLTCVRTDGRRCAQEPFQDIDHRTAYLSHYTTKTIEEWMTCKVRRGYPVSDRLVAKFRNNHLSQFFAVNDRTPEKERIAEEFACP